MLDEAAWARLESCLGQGLGACNTMGTASTMAIMAETLGLALPGSAVLAAGDPRQSELAEVAGQRAQRARRVAAGGGGGPLSRLRDGDMVSLDAYAGSLSVEADLASREPVVPAVSDRRGWPVLHRMHVLQAPEGCDYDFLRAGTPEQLAFVEPVIGRS